MDNFHFLLIEEVKNEWVVLKAGQFEIALHKMGKEHISNDKEQLTVETNVKLVFSIHEELAIFRQKLIENGVLMKEIKSFAGVRTLFCDGKDIEGNIFQLEQKLG